MHRLLARAALLALPFPCLAQTPQASIDQRVDQIVARMTLEEKAAQMQDNAPAIPRLGIPSYQYWNEALHGVARSGEATVFPQVIGMAATWDKGLIRAEGHAIGLEARAKYNEAQRQGNHGRYFGLNFWSPNINIFRDPRWGRGQETYGEDPYLTGNLATQFIRGLQGDDPNHLLAAATAKHYAVHSGPEPLRHGFNVDPSPQDLAETYLPAFRRTVTDGKVEIVMCAYNAVNGKPACANSELLTQMLRREWRFAGHVTSDCGAIDDITNGHHYTLTQTEAAAAAVKAGTDMDCDNQAKNEYRDLPKAVAAGLITDGQIDTAIKRDLRTRFRLGLFDPPQAQPYAAIPLTANHSAEHRALALRAARESIVLLKNDGILPLRPGKKMAVIGPTAASLIDLEGNYNGTPVGAVLPLDGIIAQYGPRSVRYAEGSPFVAGLPLIVPRTALPRGITATFFSGTELSGSPVATQRLPQIDVNWNWIAPANGVDPANFSVRFSGSISVPEPGTYKFQLERRRCDGKAIVERYTIHIEGAPPLSVDARCNARDAGGSPNAVNINFRDTRLRAFTIEYAHRHSGFGYAPALTFVWQPPEGALLREALRTTREADVVVAFVGLSAWLEGEEMPVEVPGFAGGDRTDIRLPAPQRALLAALEATGKPVIIVLQNGSPVALGSEGKKAKAIVEAWYGGEQGGTAIADVIRGAYNPAGRLPVTFYRSADQLPPFTDYSMRGRTYRYFTGQPEYPFGYGLSYTRFGYSGLKLGSRELRAGSTQRVSVRVRNAGSLAGDEVVQLYVTPERRDAPPRSLKGFERVHLRPGETRTVTFDLRPRDLAFADAQGTMRITPGEYRLWVGGGQKNTGAPGAAATFNVNGDLTLQP